MILTIKKATVSEMEDKIDKLFEDYARGHIGINGLKKHIKSFVINRCLDAKDFKWVSSGRD